MPHLNVCVYAISKNEERFARRWYESMKEADSIHVLDTGSTDRTVSVLRELGAIVHTAQIEPWRFDTARNQSLALVPEDAELCVCTDLDEVFHPGWRQRMEAAWTEGVSLLHYRYTWNFLEDGREGIVFYVGKAHARHHYRWIHPVHEILVPGDGVQSPYTVAEGVQLDHHADEQKSRSSYLPLLELSVREDPQDDRNMHYLGREYFFHGKWDACRETLLRHLALPSAVWRPERCASMRYLAGACEQLGRISEARSWYLRAIAEASELREPWLDMAGFCLRQKDWYGTVWFSTQALQITEQTWYYMNRQKAWQEEPYDLASLGLYYMDEGTDLTRQALRMIDQALTFCPKDARLLKNREWMEARLRERASS